MKRYLFKSLMLIAFTASIFLIGCEDDEDGGRTNIAFELNETSAYQLEDVTIEGTNLNSVQFVFVGKIQAEMVLNDDNTLTFTVPQAAVGGMNMVTLVAPGGVRATAEFEVLVRPIPIIQTISPSAAASGEQVTITGTSLNNIQSVTVGGAEATVDASSTAEKLIITVPDGLPPNVPASINITTSGGETSSESIFYVGENLIENGEFELGDGDDFDPWTKANNSHDGLKLADLTDSYAGRTLKAVSGSATQQWVPQMFSNPTGTIAGNTYTLILWIKGAKGTPGDGGHIRFSTTPNAKYSGDYNITSEWQQIIWDFEANEDDMQIVLDLGSVEDAVYFIDNVTLVATGDAGPQPVELIMNGGFEAGDGDDFTNWTKENGPEFFTATTNEEEVRSGSRALVAVGDGRDYWRTQLKSDIMETAAGNEYIASFWIKAEGGSPGDGGIVRMSTAGNGSAQYQDDVVVTTEWQKVEWSIIANGTETQIVLDLGKTEAAVYFVDDVSFLQLP